MATFTFEITVNTTGTNFTEEQLKDFIRFQIGFGGLSQNNPFVDEESTSEIIDVEIY
ncbi:hypothetical protein [Flavobacterium commune]|uniref:hypothetical protein n=1 Tax=Flavobacterium commune TaxID=1306519 RepID=UPI0012F71008|nr:hypothetical protein [Flavobacterium commune]